MRRGQAVRNARRQHERVDVERGGGRIGEHDAERRRFRPRGRAIVPRGHGGAEAGQRLRGRQAVAAEAEHRVAPAGEGACARCHRIFSVARPASARIMEMIQNRMTIVLSAQPFFSKWWCSGAIRNTRRPVRLYQ